MAVSSAGCGQNGSPTRPGQHSGGETSATAQTLPSTIDADDPIGPELAAVRQATAQFHDVVVAYAAGYTTENEPCVASPLGAMGFHAPNFALIGDPALDAARPELLLYAPTSNGRLKLVGVEHFRAVLLRNVATGEVGPRFESAKWDTAQYELVTPQPRLLGQGFELDPPPAPGVPVALVPARLDLGAQSERHVLAMEPFDLVRLKGSLSFEGGRATAHLRVPVRSFFGPLSPGQTRDPC